METSSILPTSSLQASLKMSTTNSILASSFVSQMKTTENKMTIGVKRQGSSNNRIDTSANKLSKNLFENRSQISSISKIDTHSSTLSKSLSHSPFSTASKVGSVSSTSSALSLKSSLSTVSSISTMQPSVEAKKRKVEETVSDDEAPLSSYKEFKIDDNKFRTPKKVFRESSSKERLIEEIKRKVNDTYHTVPDINVNDFQ